MYIKSAINKLDNIKTNLVSVNKNDLKKILSDLQQKTLTIKKLSSTDVVHNFFLDRFYKSEFVSDLNYLQKVLFDLLNKYFEYRSSSLNTTYCMRSVVNFFFVVSLPSLLKNHSPENILIKYVDSLQEAKKSSTTIKLHIGRIISFANFINQHLFENKDFFLKNLIKSKKEAMYKNRRNYSSSSIRRGVVSLDEFNNILQTKKLDPTSKLILDISCSRALRPQEIADIDIENISFSQNLIFLKRKTSIGKLEPIEIDQSLSKSIQKYISSVRNKTAFGKQNKFKGPLFLNRYFTKSSRYSAQSIRKKITQALHSIGLKSADGEKYTAYSLRTSSIVHFIERVSNRPADIQKFAGHTDLKTSMNYWLKAKSKDNILDQYHSVFKEKKNPSKEKRKLLRVQKSLSSVFGNKKLTPAEFLTFCTENQLLNMET